MRDCRVSGHHVVLLVGSLVPVTVDLLSNRRRTCAERWVALVTEFDQIQNQKSPSTMLRRLAWRSRRWIYRRRSWKHLGQLAREFEQITREAEGLFLGAEPLRWGVLSGGNLDRGWRQCVRLEDTLRDIAIKAKEAARHQDLGLKVDRILKILPAARVRAELGQDRGNIAAIEAQLLELIREPDLGNTDARALVEHLPGRLRPLPESLDALSRGQPPVTLYLDLYGPEAPTFVTYSKNPYIRLADIVIAPELRGKGLGSAVMMELCRYADHHGLPIQGEINPGAGSTDEALSALARWYFRHGFRQGEDAPEHWKYNGTIRREPT